VAQLDSLEKPITSGSPHMKKVKKGTDLFLRVKMFPKSIAQLRRGSSLGTAWCAPNGSALGVAPHACQVGWGGERKTPATRLGRHPKLQ